MLAMEDVDKRSVTDVGNICRGMMVSEDRLRWRWSISGRTS